MKQLRSDLIEIKPFWETLRPKSEMLKMVSPNSADVGNHNLVFRRLISIQAYISFLSDICVASGYSHSRTATGILGVFNKAEELETVSFLGALQRVVCWEHILIKAFAPKPWSDGSTPTAAFTSTTVPIPSSSSGAVSYPVPPPLGDQTQISSIATITTNTTSQTEAASLTSTERPDSDIRNPTETPATPPASESSIENAKALRSIAASISQSLNPFFSAMIKLLSSRQVTDEALKKQALFTANLLTQVLSGHLVWPGADDHFPNFAYLTVCLNTASQLLTKERGSRSNLNSLMIILTYPYGYQSGFNLGYNCAESVNFTNEAWIENGRKGQACKYIDDALNRIVGWQNVALLSTIRDLCPATTCKRTSQNRKDSNRLQDPWPDRRKFCICLTGDPSREFSQLAQKTKKKLVVRQNPGDTDLFYIQRLIYASVSALGFQSNHLLNNNLLLNSPTQSQLALRLLTSGLKNLSWDPFTAHKFTDALTSALNSGGHAEDAFDLKTFVNKIHLVGLELVILLHPLVSLPNLSSGAPLPTGSLPPGLPPPLGHNPNVVAKKRQIAMDAVQILCDSIGVALHSLSIPINPSGSGSETTTSASEEQMPELTPIQLSKLLSIIISDTPVPFTEDSKEPELLWTSTVQRATFQAVVSRVGQELTSQIANHCLADAKFTSNPSPIALLYRICSDPVICSADLCKTVLIKTKRGGGPETEEVAEQLAELIELANKYGNEFPIDHVSWIRAIGEVYNNRIRWSEVIKLTFDQPAEQVTLPDGWGLRFLGKVLSLAPSLAASPAEGSSPTSTTNNAFQVDSSQGPPSSKGPSRSTSSQSSHPPSPTTLKNALPSQASTVSTAAISSLFERWTHQYTKIRLIDRLLYLPLDASPFLHALKPNPLAPMNGPSCKKVVSAEDVSNNSPTVRVLAKSVEMSGWNVKELLCEVAKLLSPEYSFQDGQAEKDEAVDKIIEKATDIMERACKTNPELVMMALIQVPTPWAMLHNDLMARLLQSFLKGHPSHQLIFLRIWQLDPDFLMTALRDFYHENEMNVTRVLDITQDLKVLDQVLNYQPDVNMIIDIASLASQPTRISKPGEMAW
ncbi:hypothetical protein PSTG_01342 [Puccinia striiformis f. sp. tritici PST-78]|uniref:CCR4-NOT transcription complex subunit 1 HEAT repeat domain-containing protein n=1 Tax=Puccinia striiformis f. sp. tritici PST-78 TaxID=1165861 RepID=A0A0L0W2Q2_9BASI|nr:hypothetical protein PSTG_01342 [Puccinia striiformis f. sp. tritici PST-78]